MEKIYDYGSYFSYAKQAKSNPQAEEFVGHPDGL